MTSTPDAGLTGRTEEEIGARKTKCFIGDKHGMRESFRVSVTEK